MSTRGLQILFAIVLAGLLYGSLYPFSFSETAAAQGAFGHLLSTWSKPPSGRGDTISNLLLYIPFGLLAERIVRPRCSLPTSIALVVLGGALLSTAMELLQYYDAGRDSSLSDVYLNATSTLIGAATSVAFGRVLDDISLLPRDFSRFALFVVLSWLAWRMFPYIPVIDAHKYWSSLRPVIYTRNLYAYDVFRYSVMWAAILHVSHSGLKIRNSAIAIYIATIVVLLARILIADQVLTLPDIAGAIVGLIYLRTVLRWWPAQGAAMLAAIFFIALLLGRILPFQLSDRAGTYHWMPFYSLMHDGLWIGMQFFLQKCAFYSTGLYLLVEAGLGLATAAIAELAAVLITGLLGAYFAGRPGEVTDAVIVAVLLVAYIFLERQNGFARLHSRRATRSGL